MAETIAKTIEPASAEIAVRPSALAIGSLVLAACAWSVAASSGPIQWMDNGWLLFIASQGTYFPEDFYATTHPLYQTVTTLLFNLFGPYAVAYLNSLLLLPIAYVVYRLGHTLDLDRPFAALAALGVVLLQNVFWVSTKIEVYALHLLIVLAAHWLVFDRTIIWRPAAKIFTVGILTGLGAATHQLTFIVLFPLYVHLSARTGWRVLLTVPGLALGLFPIYLGLYNQIASGHDLSTLIRLFMTGSDGASEGGWEGDLFRFDQIWAGKVYALLVLVSLCGVGALGLLRYRGTTEHRILWWAATLNLVFAVSYRLNDRFTFFLPGAAFYTILGVTWLYRRDAARDVARQATLALVLAHPLLLIGLYILASHGLIEAPTHSAALPYRNDVKYYLSPYLPDQSAETFVSTYEQSVPEGAVVVSDYTPLGALHSAQVTGRFLHRALLLCDGGRQAWPDTMYLVRTGYCERYLEDYRKERAPLGWIVRRP